MTGITEYSVADIYDYIEQHKERDFVLKFSAIEIYNEAVRDLLSSDPSPLRLLDDPEKGIIIEKLSEETLRDESHLWELLTLCEAQRQIGETSLNEMSSRSHQILKLTIESSSMENFSTLAASVNFVDLAGSERVSQSLSGGARLKEGCHINRSLLTLGTVIRKLSKGRNTHIPYRDSKLTRILQHSLGGNARTTIICTMSPARSHIEQSRNTLLFATCAKEVATSAQVNVVMSDKALVKHLQKELARLEIELRRPVLASSSGYSEALRERNFHIKKMEREILELMQQRDVAQSRLEDLLRVLGEDQASRDWDRCSHVSSSHVPNQCEDVISVSESSFTTHQIQEFSVPRHANTLDDINNGHDLHPHLPCKDVRCIEMDESNKNKTEGFTPLPTGIIGKFLLPFSLDPGDVVDHGPKKKENEVRDFLEDNKLLSTSGFNGNIACVRGQNDNEVINLSTISEMEHPDERKKVVNHVDTRTKEKSPSYFKDLTDSRSCQLSRSRSCRASLMASSPSSFSFHRVEENDRTPPSFYLKDFTGRPERFQTKYSTLENNIELLEKPSQKDIQKYDQRITNDIGRSENMRAASNFIDGVKEMDQVEYHQENHRNSSDFQDLERTISEDCGLHKNAKDVGVDPMQNSMDSPSRWPAEFQRKQQEIIELWDACNVSLVHRTCFFLLFEGDPADSVYMEVELRRLSFLRRTLSGRGLNGTPLVDSPIRTVESSERDLRREREMLCRQMKKKMSEEERKKLYTQWGISFHSKQRRMQLAKLLWAEPCDVDCVRESATVIAKLISLTEPGLVTKEMFGLRFNIPQLWNNRASNWKSWSSSFK